MIKINSQEDLDILLNIVDWNDAFIREWYMLSPSYIEPESRGTVAADFLPIMYVLICTSELNCPCLELIFVEVDQIYFANGCDLNPIARFHKDKILFSFYEIENTDIQFTSLYYRILDKDSWGSKQRYGIRNVFDESGSLLIENL